MTTGEPSTDIPSSPKRRRFWPQFTLRNLLFGMFAVGFLLMLFREVAELRREMKTAGRYDPIPLEVTDESKIHVRGIGYLPGTGFLLRVYVPENDVYELCVAKVETKRNTENVLDLSMPRNPYYRMFNESNRREMPELPEPQFIRELDRLRLSSMPHGMFPEFRIMGCYDTNQREHPFEIRYASFAGGASSTPSPFEIPIKRRPIDLVRYSRSFTYSILPGENIPDRNRTVQFDPDRPLVLWAIYEQCNSNLDPRRHTDDSKPMPLDECMIVWLRLKVIQPLKNIPPSLEPQKNPDEKPMEPSETNRA